MTTYCPDNWVILKITAPEETLYKVLAGWSGGYLDGDSWKINSGIVSVSLQDDYWLFAGYSGSIYQCWQGRYGLRLATAPVYNRFRERFGDLIEIMDENTNWKELIENEKNI